MQPCDTNMSTAPSPAMMVILYRNTVNPRIIRINLVEGHQGTKQKVAVKDKNLEHIQIQNLIM
jgi:hypothetical protein